VEFASLLNNQPGSFDKGAFLSFSRVSKTLRESWDDSTSTLTLGSATHHRITIGLHVQSFQPNTSIQMLQNGESTGVYFPVSAVGSSTLDWIYSYPAGTKIQFEVASGGFSLLSPGGNNAYLVVSGYNIS
jgi:hypothetical protein